MPGSCLLHSFPSLRRFVVRGPGPFPGSGERCGGVRVTRFGAARTNACSRVVTYDYARRARFELAISALLGIIFAGFLYETVRIGPSVHGSLHGLIPSMHGTTYLYIAVGIVGATVIPHVIYLHSALTK